MATKSNLYPVKAKLVGDAEVQVEILQITHNGVLVDSLATPLAVGKTFQVHFEFPLLNQSVDVTALVTRTYAELNPPGSARKTRSMNELVYKKPPRSFNEILIKFLATSAQRQKA